MEKNEKMEPYNWVAASIRYAQIAATFAGFSITFIVLILGGNLNDFNISPSLSLNQIAILLFGISSGFFIFSSQRFLLTQQYDLWMLSEDYKNSIKEKEEIKTALQWKDFLIKNDNYCRKYEKQGRYAYNTAIIIMIFGLFAVIWSYNFIIAAFILGISLLLEIYQIRGKWRK